MQTYVGPLEDPFHNLLERAGWRFTAKTFRSPPNYVAFKRQVNEILEECKETTDRPRFVLFFTTRKLAGNFERQAEHMPTFMCRDDTHKVISWHDFLVFAPCCEVWF